MAIIYAFSTKKRIDRSEADFEIVRWSDPVIQNIARDQGGRVLVDGLVPLHLAKRMKAMCERHNRKVGRP